MFYNFLFSRGTSYGRGVHINFKSGLFDWKSEVLAPLLRVKNYRNTSSPYALFSPILSNKFFEIAVLLKLFQRPDKKKTPTSTEPSSARGQTWRVMPRVLIWFLWKGCSCKLKRGLIWFGIDSSSSLFRSQQGSEGNPPFCPFCAKFIPWNFQDSNVVKISQKIKYQKFQVNTPSSS